MILNKREKKTKKKNTKKKKKTKKKIPSLNTKELDELEKKLENSPQLKRYEILENYFKSGKIRKILPKKYKIFSWLTPIAIRGFNSLDDVPHPTMHEMSFPAGSSIKKKKKTKKKKKKKTTAGLFDDTRLKLFGKKCSEYKSCPEDTITTENNFRRF